MYISRLSGAEEEMASPSPPLGAERVGVRWGIPGRRPPTSPSHACGVGPFLSPLKGGEGFPEPASGLNRGEPLRACNPWIPAFAGKTSGSGNSLKIIAPFLA